MPIFEFECAGGHRFEHYFHVREGVPEVVECWTCGAAAPRLFPLAVPLQYFSESHGRVIANLDPRRMLHSPGEHAALMKQRGVEPATDWHVSMRPSRM